jgi:DNA-binding NtrC family response regulator
MSSPGTSGSNKILIVDADLRSSERLAALLREDGFMVEVARDATSASTRLGSAHPPHTLITELDVPGGDAVGLARFARMRRPGMAVIVVTRYANALRSFEFGAPSPCLLPKPLDYARLLELLRGPVSTERTSDAPHASSRL